MCWFLEGFERISQGDFIMKIKQAEEKYGKKMLKKMEKHLDGITVSIDPETKEIDIPERDLEMAFDMITKGRSNIPWD